MNLSSTLTVEQKQSSKTVNRFNQMKKLENVIGFIILIAALIIGNTFLLTDHLFFRLVMGIGFGYVLSRAYTGFAGSVNRAFTTGSTKLMRTMMFMFLLTAILTTAFLMTSEAGTYNLSINPINLGLIAGAALFGFGMAFSSCCASGALTDLVSGTPRAFITLIFFGFGVFIGFPIQMTAGWVTESMVTSSTGEQYRGGVFLPDLFKWDGLNGYLGALVFIGLICGIVIYLSYRYEKRRKDNDTYVGHFVEKIQDRQDELDSQNIKLFSTETYHRLFVKPWTLKTGAILLAVLFTILMGVTHSGWGASTPYGLWFGKLLMLFGASPESLAAFTHKPTEFYTTPFFQEPVSVQNFGILVGATIFLLTAGKFKETFSSGLHISKKEIGIFALGGLTMGFGTRLAFGCNVGGLYTPIAHLSLSGWIFFALTVVGAIVGNMLGKKWTS